MSSRVCVSILALTISGCSIFPFLQNSDAEQFERFIDNFFRGFYAAQEGDAVPLAWLMTDADSVDAASADRALSELRRIDTSRLSVDDRIDWLQIEAGLKRDILDTMLHQAETIPGRYLTVGGLYWQIAGDHAPDESEWKTVLKTLRGAPAALELGKKQLRQPPPSWVRLTANTAQRYEDFIASTLTEKVQSSAPESLKPALLASASTSVSAIASFRKYMTDTLTQGRDDSWVVGREYYDWLLREYHFLPYTAESMIETGWKIHRETKHAIHDLAKRIDPGKSAKQLMEEMKLRHPQPFKITEAYHRESDRVRTLLVDKNLISIPAPETLLFVPTPPSLRETYAWGGYGGIELEQGLRKGRFFVTDIVPEMTSVQVDEKLRVQNDGWVTVIALHEGYPGHHLQALYSANNPRPVRSHFASTYFGEGWALYAESWMAREGFYQDTDDSLAWLQMRLWRTARVIIDPSIHIGKMSYDEAVEFMISEVGLERSAAEAEVNRYTTWPTQAPSYIIGWLEIEKLKEEIREIEQERFSERRFVETLLGAGSLPPQLMRRAVLERYVHP